MEELERAKNRFEEYIAKFDSKEEQFKIKKTHCYRVMKISEDIAEKENFNKKEVEIATIIGLLHDIGRFDEYKITKGFDAKLKFDHGDYGEKLLKENEFIRQFIQNNEYDETILKSIKNHNKLNIEEGLEEKTLKFCELIRDADKIDIYYEACEIFWKNEKQNVEDGIVKKYIEEQMKLEKLINKKDIDRNTIDDIIWIMALAYDLNYKSSFEILKSKKYIDKLLEQFNFKKEETQQKMEELKNIVNSYIKKRSV